MGFSLVVDDIGVDGDFLPVLLRNYSLGPVLFLIKINNISKLNLNGKLFLFADDNLIFLEIEDWYEVSKRAKNK